MRVIKIDYESLKDEVMRNPDPHTVGKKMSKLEKTATQTAKTEGELNRFEKFEVDVFKRIKKDNWFTHFLETFMQRKFDIMAESASNFGASFYSIVFFLAFIIKSRINI